MRGPNSIASTPSNEGAACMAAFKQGLLRNLLLGLRARTTEAAAARPFHAMSLQDRKRAVKRSADVAMAAARGASGPARWPKAILSAAAASACKVRRKSGGACCSKRVVRRRSRRVVVDAKKKIIRGYYAAASRDDDVARSLQVRRRTIMALRKVIPGGGAAAMDDEAALLRETVDYVVHLRAQVDVLRRVSAAVQRQRSAFLRDRDEDPSLIMGE